MSANSPSPAKKPAIRRDCHEYARDGNMADIESDGEQYGSGMSTLVVKKKTMRKKNWPKRKSTNVGAAISSTARSGPKLGDSGVARLPGCPIKRK